MGVWLRSQSGEGLICTVRLRAEETLSGYVGRLMALDVSGRWEIIGVFSTLKAALAELDAIDRWIATGGKGVYRVGKEVE